MNLTRKFLIGIACFPLSQYASAEPFEYRMWSNKKGMGIEARLDHIVNAKSIIIQAKNGGKRYPLEKIQLSDESNEYLDLQIGDAKKALARAVTIDADLIYKGIALQLRDETEAAAVGKTLSLEVNGFKISTDKLTATLCLDSDVFATLRLAARSEFYASWDSLLFRSTIRRAYWWYWTSGIVARTATGTASSDTGPNSTLGNGINARYGYGRRMNVDGNSILIVTKGDRWKFKFSPDVSIKWGLVGVTEGPIITDR